MKPPGTRPLASALSVLPPKSTSSHLLPPFSLLHLPIPYRRSSCDRLFPFVSPRPFLFFLSFLYSHSLIIITVRKPSSGTRHSFRDHSLHSALPTPHTTPSSSSRSLTQLPARYFTASLAPCLVRGRDRHSLLGIYQPISPLQSSFADTARRQHELHRATRGLPTSVNYSQHTSSYPDPRDIRT